MSKYSYFHDGLNVISSPVSSSKARCIKEFIIAALLEWVHFCSFNSSVSLYYVPDAISTGVTKMAETTYSFLRDSSQHPKSSWEPSTVCFETSFVSDCSIPSWTFGRRWTSPGLWVSQCKTLVSVQGKHPGLLVRNPSNFTVVFFVC